MIRISLNCFYVLCVLVCGLLLSYAQNVSANDFMENPNAWLLMTDEQFNRFLGTLPRLSSEELEALEELGMQGNVSAEDRPPKRKSYIDPANETYTRQP